MKIGVQGASEPVQEGVQKCPEYFRNVSRKRLERVHGHHRTGRTMRTDEKQTPYRGKRGSALVAVVLLVGIVSTYYNIFWKYQIALYAFSLALGVWCDFLGLIGRTLAPQSRKIIAGLVALYIVELFAPSLRLGEVLAILTLFAYILVTKLNSFWLDSYNWEMSPEVVNTIANAPDNLAANAWQDRGKREMRALLLTLGYEITEDDLDGTFSAPYKLGYMNGFQKTEQHRAAVQKAQEQAESNRERAETAETALEACRAELVELRAELEEKVSFSRQVGGELSRIREELAAVQAENARLMNDNGALVGMMETAEAHKEAEELTKVSAEDRARDYLKAGYSVRYVAELVGLNKTKVGNIRLELKALGELTEEIKVVPIKTATA